MTREMTKEECASCVRDVLELLEDRDLSAADAADVLLTSVAVIIAEDERPLMLAVAVTVLKEKTAAAMSGDRTLLH